MVESAFCGGFGKTSLKTSPRPTAAPAVFARGAGAGSARKTAGAGVSEEASTGRFILFGGSLPAIFSGAFVTWEASGWSSRDSAGFVVGCSLVTEAEVEEGWL